MLKGFIVKMLLLVITSGQQINLNGKFKLKTSNNPSTRICCENVVDVALLFIFWFSIFVDCVLQN